MNEQPKKLSNSVWAGVIILAIGSFLLFDRLDLFDFPRWLFSWKTFLIALGIIIGASKKFEGIGWLIMILIGSVFLVDDLFDIDFNFHRYAFPLAIMIVGAFIVGRSVFGSGARDARKNSWASKGDGIVTLEGGEEDHFDLTTAFGGIKRVVYSKNFKGGQATCIFGGTEIDLTQADIQGTVIIDTVQIFGGTKIKIPSNWQLKSEITAVLGGIDDKRKEPSNYSADKKLILTGFAMFGGVEIKSY